MDKQTKFEQMYAHAQNLVSAYDDLGKIRELFKEAVEAENFLKNFQHNIEQEKANLEAVTNAVHEMDGEYSKRVEKMKEMEEQTKHKVVRLEQQYVDKYEADYGVKVKEAERVLENLARRIEDKGVVLESLEKHFTDLNSRVQLREGHLDRLNEQIEKLKKILVD